MLDVPNVIKELFEQDSISKNFRVHFVDGEYRDLVNADFVSESVVFTESAMSASNFKFGLCESGSISFKTYFPEDMKNLWIFCSIEIDVSSLSTSDISRYGMSSSDVPYKFYRVPYGYFLVDSWVLSGNDVYTVIAYNCKTIGNEPAYVQYPEVIDRLLRWGYEADVMRSQLGGYNVDKYNYVCKKRFHMSHLAALCSPNSLDLFENLVETHTDSVFKRSTEQTIEVDYRLFEKPNNMGAFTYLFVRGIYIYLNANPNATGSKTTPCAFTGRNNGVEASGSKEPNALDLSYNFNLSRIGDDSLFKLSWENSINIDSIVANIRAKIKNHQGLSDDEVNNLYTKDYIANLISPSIKFIDMSSLPSTETWEIAKPLEQGGIKYDRYGYNFPADFFSGSIFMNNRSNSPYINETARIVRLPVNKSGNKYSLLVPDVRTMCDPHDTMFGQHDEFIHGSGGSSNKFVEDNYVAICIPTYIKVITTIDFSLQQSSFWSYHPSYIDYTYPLNASITVNTLTTPKLEVYKDKLLAKYDEGNKNCIIDNYYVDLDVSKFKGDDSHIDNLAVYYFHNETYQYGFHTGWGSLRYIYNNDNPALDPKKILSDYAEYLGGFFIYDRTEQFKLKFVPFEEKISSALYPNKPIRPNFSTLYPEYDLYPSDVTPINRGMWRKFSIGVSELVQYRALRYKHQSYVLSDSNNSSGVGTIKHSGENATIITQDIQNLTEYNLTENFIYNNFGVDYNDPDTSKIENDSIRLTYILSKLNTLVYNKFSVEMRALPFLEPLDCIIVNIQSSGASSYVFRHRISGIQSLIDTIDNA